MGQSEEREETPVGVNRQDRTQGSWGSGVLSRMHPPGPGESWALQLDWEWGAGGVGGRSEFIWVAQHLIWA